MTDEPDAILAIKIVLNEKLNSKLIPLLIHLLVLEKLKEAGSV
jgi:hypothetical protein